MSLTRRDFLKLAAIGLTTGFLAACRPATPPAPNEATPGSTVEGPAVTATLDPLTVVPGTPALNVILGRPAADRVTVSVLPAGEGEILLEVGTASGVYAARIGPAACPAGLPTHIRVDGLQANTQYYYRASQRRPGEEAFTAAPEGSFVTQRPPGSEFTFTVDADPHQGDPNASLDLYAVTLANVLADRPDFHINLGDTFMTEKLQARTADEVAATLAGMRPSFGIIGPSVPLYLVNGNHEGELGWLRDGTGGNVAVWSTLARRQYYPNPAPDDFYSGSTTAEEFTGVRDGYYAWTWGEAIFVVLDPYWYTLRKPQPEPDSNWEWTLGREQYDWLKQTLENSTASFKFVFLHNLVGGFDHNGRGGIEAAGFYEWGGNNLDGSWGFDAQRPGWGNPIHDLLAANRVSAVFHGHDHVFVRQELDGIVYQECPQPDAARANNTRIAEEYGYVHGDVFGSSGHLRVTVRPDGATVEYVRAWLPQEETPSRRNGQVDFTYTIASSGTTSTDG